MVVLFWPCILFNFWQTFEVGALFYLSRTLFPFSTTPTNFKYSRAYFLLFTEKSRRFFIFWSKFSKTPTLSIALFTFQELLPEINKTLFIKKLMVTLQKIKINPSYISKSRLIKIHLSKPPTPPPHKHHKTLPKKQPHPHPLLYYPL